MKPGFTKKCLEASTHCSGLFFMADRPLAGCKNFKEKKQEEAINEYNYGLLF